MRDTTGHNKLVLFDVSVQVRAAVCTRAHCEQVAPGRHRPGGEELTACAKSKQIIELKNNL